MNHKIPYLSGFVRSGQERLSLLPVVDVLCVNSVEESVVVSVSSAPISAPIHVLPGLPLVSGRAVCIPSSLASIRISRIASSVILISRATSLQSYISDLPTNRLFTHPVQISPVPGRLSSKSSRITSWRFVVVIATVLKKSSIPLYFSAHKPFFQSAHFRDHLSSSSLLK